jgi:hypothetical protein
MAELFRMFGMSFFFYSLEHLSIHIDVRNADGVAKFNLEPEIVLIEAKGIKPRDLVLAEALIQERKDEIVKRKDEIVKKWKEIHGE